MAKEMTSKERAQKWLIDNGYRSDLGVVREDKMIALADEFDAAINERLAQLAAFFILSDRVLFDAVEIVEKIESLRAKPFKVQP